MIRIVTATLLAAALAAGFSGTRAEAASLLTQCRAGSAKGVVSCCQNYVREHGRPLWMRQAGDSCRDLRVVCTQKGQDRSCAPRRKPIIEVSRGNPGGNTPSSSTRGGGNNPSYNSNPSPNTPNSPTHGFN